jgi:protein arginine N-methyltransferase 1
MYTIADYGAMIADEARMDAFVRVLRSVVHPGAVVVDVGAGTGIFALLSCAFGARRVYAIEPDDAIQVAREMAVANGFADRIEFIQALSTEVTLPEQADVIVADIGGALPWFQRHIPSMVDARRRFLRPGGVLIPQRDTTWAAVVEAPDEYERRTGPWHDRFGLDMSAARRIATNTWNRARVQEADLLTGLARWAEVDYATVEEPDVRATINWTVRRAGTGHGVAAGFDRIVRGDVRLSNAPDAPDHTRPKRIYGTVLFPWPEPVALDAGDRVAVDLEARLLDQDYLWKWTTRVFRQHAQSSERRFFQSTFFGAPLSPAQLARRSSTYRPTLNAQGLLLCRTLDLMKEGAALGEIAACLMEQFPGRFRSPGEALGYVGELSKTYG